MITIMIMNTAMFTNTTTNMPIASAQDASAS